MRTRFPTSPTWLTVALYLLNSRNRTLQRARCSLMSADYGSQLAPTTYRWRCSLPDSTVVTQYRLDKVGRRWCRQDDITLSDRQVGRERPPTRLIADSM
jgi:hypothetical protein